MGDIASEDDQLPSLTFSAPAAPESEVTMDSDRDSFPMILIGSKMVAKREFVPPPEMGIDCDEDNVSSILLLKRYKCLLSP